MYRYLLDSDVFIPFQRASCLDALEKAAQDVPMAVANDVVDELTVPIRSGETRSKWQKEANEFLSKSAIQIIRILEGSEEDVIRRSFCNTVGKGEAASAAVALRQLELIFVSQDNKAAHGTIKLYRELPGETGRIMGLHAFLRLLVEKNTLSSNQAKSIADVRPLSAPTWWTAWLAVNQAT